jgi:hypothetical protein
MTACGSCLSELCSCAAKLNAAYSKLDYISMGVVQEKIIVLSSAQ